MNNNALLKKLLTLIKVVADIQSALGTKETGDALVEVASNAHKAEQELAKVMRELDELHELGRDE